MSSILILSFLCLLPSLFNFQISKLRQLPRSLQPCQGRNPEDYERVDNVASHLSRSSRHLGLNATQQLLLRSNHHQIGSLIMQSKQIINLIALLQVVMDLQPNERFEFIKSGLLTIAASHIIFLQRFFLINSFVADIPAAEEGNQDQEW